MIDQLREAIDARLQLARAAHGSVGNGNWTVTVHDDQQFVIIDGIGWTVASGHMSPPLTPFLAANDPASVERHCLADLAILDLHKPWNFSQNGEEDHCGVCMQLRNNEWHFLHSPCPTLAALAEAYGVDLAGRSEESP